MIEQEEEEEEEEENNNIVIHGLDKSSVKSSSIRLSGSVDSDELDDDEDDDNQIETLLVANKEQHKRLHHSTAQLNVSTLDATCVQGSTKVPRVPNAVVVTYARYHLTCSIEKLNKLS